MTPLLKQRIAQGRVVLFLGAGASVGCRTSSGDDAAPLGGQLKRELVELAALVDSTDDDLQDVFGAAQKTLGRHLQAHLEARYSKLRPAAPQLELAEYPWARVYTTNIDDSIFSALVEKSKQKVTPRARTSASSPINSSLANLDLVFLNGYINWPNDGYIFTATEYAKAQAANLPWFKQLVRDFYEYTFLFVGTRLKESTFSYHVATHSQTTHSSLGRSYLLLPNISSAQRETLSELNVEFIEGKLQDLTAWFKAEFPVGLSRDRVLTERTPILSFFNERKPSAADLNAFDNLTIVSRANLPAPRLISDLTSSTVEYYKGFKPSWTDIISSIPARLDIVHELLAEVNDKANTIIVLFGPMGSGKTTTLMQTALELSESGLSVYYIDEGTDDLMAIVNTLESVHPAYALFIERASKVDRQLRRCLSENVIRNGKIICGERENTFNNQTHELLSEFNPATIRQHEITDSDAEAILAKVETFAPAVGFTGLGHRERKRLLLEHSKRQLLIGLLTATYGLGYRQMIIAEYAALPIEARQCLMLVGLATYHDLPAPRRMIETVLREAYAVAMPLDDVLLSLTGIVREERDRLQARHPVYINEIFRSRTVRDDSEQALTGLISYFSTLPVPISAHRERLGSNVVDLFKKCVNHAFVAMLLREPERVLNFYRAFERAFSLDGLFWLQMGLAYRNVGKHDEALEALESAMRLHPMTHTQHALAQQKVIIASKLAISGESSKARVYLDDGMASLKLLDTLDNLVGGRYYPIVALSEGHVFVTKELDGEDRAKVLAKAYAEVITQRLNREGAVFRGTIAQRLSAPQVRAKKALQRLNRFIFDGRWEFGSDLASIMTTDLPDSKIY